MIGKRIRLQATDPWRLDGLDEHRCVEAVVEHFDLNPLGDGRARLSARLDQILTHNSVKYDRLVVVNRYEGQSVAALEEGAQVTVNATGVQKGFDPQTILQPSLWWRDGDLAVTGTAKLS